MNKKLYKVTLFVFYFLFVISYFETNWIDSIRYIGILIILIVGTLSYLIDKDEKKEVLLSYSRINLILYYSMFVTLTLTIFYSNYQITSLFKVISLMALFLVVFYFLPRLIRQVGLVSHNYLLIYSIISGISIAFLISPEGHIVSYGARVTTFDTRLKLFFYHPNILGSMCFIAIAFFQLNYLLLKEKILQKKSILSLALIFVLLYLLYLTNSRTPLYGLIILQIIILYKKYLNTILKKILIFILMFVSIPVYIDSVLNISYEDLNILLSDRLYLWNQAITQLIVEDRLLTGIGSYLNSQLDTLNIVLIDNGYIYILYQNGIIALMILLIICGYTLVSILRFKGDESIRNFIFSLFIVYLFIGFFENSLFNISNLVCISILSTTYYINKYNINVIKDNH